MLWVSPFFLPFLGSTSMYSSRRKRIDNLHIVIGKKWARKYCDGRNRSILSLEIPWSVCGYTAVWAPRLSPGIPDRSCLLPPQVHLWPFHVTYSRRQNLCNDFACDRALDSQTKLNIRTLLSLGFTVETSMWEYGTILLVLLSFHVRVWNTL